MRKLIFACATAALLTMSQSAFALLSPLNQSIVEIKAVLDNQQFAKAIPSGEDIQDIIKIDSGYLIITDNYRLQVDVNYTPQDKMGPAKFNLSYHTAVSTMPTNN
ncbi:MAG: hypothetical protein JHC93_07050 [Parachlamydiales bacterium]|nr:hypothetical protein [Parachlamydiales bacterium]